MNFASRQLSVTEVIANLKLKVTLTMDYSYIAVSSALL